jgi:hypothetical protein
MPPTPSSRGSPNRVKLDLSSITECHDESSTNSNVKLQTISESDSSSASVSMTDDKDKETENIPMTEDEDEFWRIIDGGNYRQEDEDEDSTELEGDEMNDDKQTKKAEKKQKENKSEEKKKFLFPNENKAYNVEYENEIEEAEEEEQDKKEVAKVLQESEDEDEEENQDPEICSPTEDVKLPLRTATVPVIVTVNNDDMMMADQLVESVSVPVLSSPPTVHFSEPVSKTATNTITVPPIVSPNYSPSSRVPSTSNSTENKASPSKLNVSTSSSPAPTPVISTKAAVSRLTALSPSLYHIEEDYEKFDHFDSEDLQDDRSFVLFFAEPDKNKVHYAIWFGSEFQFPIKYTNSNTKHARSNYAKDAIDGFLKRNPEIHSAIQVLKLEPVTYIEVEGKESDTFWRFFEFDPENL